jgi:PAS domain-containing protein
MSNMLSRDESVEQLDFALKSAGMGVYSWDLLEGIMRWDTQMYALFGLEHQSVYRD